VCYKPIQVNRHPKGQAYEATTPYEREGQATVFSLELESALVKNTTTIVKSWRLIIHNENILPTRGCQAVADVINCHLMSNNRFLEKLPGPSGGRDSNRLEETKRESVQQCCPAVLTSSAAQQCSPAVNITA